MGRMVVGRFDSWSKWGCCWKCSQHYNIPSDVIVADFSNQSGKWNIPQSQSHWLASKWWHTLTFLWDKNIKMQLTRQPISSTIDFNLGCVGVGCVLGVKATLRFRVQGDVMTWKRLPRHWPFVRRIHRLPVDFPAQSATNAELWFFCKSGQTNEQKKNITFKCVTVYNGWYTYSCLFQVSRLIVEVCSICCPTRGCASSGQTRRILSPLIRRRRIPPYWGNLSQGCVGIKTRTQRVSARGLP